MQRTATHHVTPVDHGDALPQLRGGDCAFLTSRTAADHSEIVMWNTHAANRIPDSASNRE